MILLKVLRLYRKRINIWLKIRDRMGKIWFVTKIKWDRERWTDTEECSDTNGHTDRLTAR